MVTSKLWKLFENCRMLQTRLQKGGTSHLATLIGVPEAAKRLDYCPTHLRRIIESDSTFPAFKRNGTGHYRIDPDKLEEWIANQPTRAEARSAQIEAQRPKQGRPSRQFQQAQ